MCYKDQQLLTLRTWQKRLQLQSKVKKKAKQWQPSLTTRLQQQQIGGRKNIKSSQFCFHYCPIS